MLREEYKDLSVPEKILLVEDIWDSIAEENADVSLTNAQKKLLEQRLKSYHTSTKRITWNEIKVKVKSRN